MLEQSLENAVRMLPSLNRQIESLELRESNSRREVRSARRKVRFAKIVHLLHKLQAKLRAPKDIYHLWPLGITLVSPLVAGLLGFIIVHTLSSSYVAAVVCATLFALTAAGTLAKVLCFTDDRLLAVQLHEDRVRHEETRDAYSRVYTEYIETRRMLADVRERQRKIVTLVGYERMRLLEKNWRDMRGDAWEEFLFDVFSALGATVRHTGRTGDHGVDLIVEIESRRYAVQAKGYRDSVGNSAVQEAVAGMAMYHCNCCAVITNSYLTNGAIELAGVNGCLLIGGNKIPALVLGEIPL